MKYARIWVSGCVLFCFSEFVACGGGDDSQSGHLRPDAGADGDAGPATCGNGIVEDTEACDDGNTQENDGCSADCSRLNICELPLDKGAEPCRKKSSSGYYYYHVKTNTCRRIRDFSGCGGNRNRFHERRRCTKACVSICGDGRVNGAEECDDYNRKSGDGCSAECRLEGGLVTVNGDIRSNACPIISGLSVAPLQVAVGGKLTLTASATDPDDDEIILEWTATEGDIIEGDGGDSEYECSTVGEHTLTLTASDTFCADSIDVAVTCVEFDE